MSDERGVWPKPGAKGQNRLSTSKRPNPGPPDRPASYTVGKGNVSGAETANATDTGAVHRAGKTPATSAFNAKEVELSMRTKVEPQPSVYRPGQKGTSGRSGNAPQVIKSATTMANGKEFWNDLRKQFTALQSSGGTRAGG